MQNRIADLDQKVVIDANATTITLSEGKTEAIIFTENTNETAPAPREIRDYPNFIVVDGAGKKIEVHESRIQIVTAVGGTQGPPGQPGPPGSLSGSIDGLNDVLIVNLQNGQLLKYNSPLQQWVNSDYLDGGNF